jgi:hypothetical protein
VSHRIRDQWSPSCPLSHQNGTLGSCPNSSDLIDTNRYFGSNLIRRPWIRWQGGLLPQPTPRAVAALKTSAAAPPASSAHGPGVLFPTGSELCTEQRRGNFKGATTHRAGAATDLTTGHGSQVANSNTGEQLDQRRWSPPPHNAATSAHTIRRQTRATGLVATDGEGEGLRRRQSSLLLLDSHDNDG